MGWDRDGMSVRVRTFPTAASPSRTSFTLLLGLGAELPLVSAIVYKVCSWRCGGGFEGQR